MSGDAPEGRALGTAPGLRVTLTPAFLGRKSSDEKWSLHTTWLSLSHVTWRAASQSLRMTELVGNLWKVLALFSLLLPHPGTAQRSQGGMFAAKKGYFVKYILQRCLALWWLIFITMQSVKKVYYVRLVVVSALIVKAMEILSSSSARENIRKH